MKTIYRVESPTGEVRVLEVSRNETGYNVYIDDSNICESITEEELTEQMSNSIAANDIIQNIDDLLAEYPVDECISILQEVVKQIDVRIKDFSEHI